MKEGFLKILKLFNIKQKEKLAHIVFYTKLVQLWMHLFWEKNCGSRKIVLGQNWINQSNQYPSKAGILKINIDNGLTLKHKNKLKAIKQKKNSLKYNKFAKLNLIPDRKNINGTEKLKIIKRLYNNEFLRILI